MASGRINFYNGARGFGFIRPEGSDGDVFFHIQDYEDSGSEPKEGAQVTYDVGSKDGRKRAMNVRPAGTAAAR